jgi:hypothetical protein
MIPSDYRLETVVVALIERLDSARRSFDDRDTAEQAFREIAEKHVAAVVSEWEALDFQASPERHSEFLRDEVRETFLPRFSRVALSMNEAEASGYGLGWWATTAGRVALVGIALAIFFFVLLRFIYVPMEWPLILVDLAVPFLPDVMAWLEHRRYRGALQELVLDMGRIQEQQLAYVPVEGTTSTSAMEDAKRRAKSAQRRAARDKGGSL